ncbi:17706_t:CDS:2 [Funneliformis geosporum]|nr:17706_t:CDS:2 [Funneliformis geosporum]
MGDGEKAIACELDFSGSMRDYSSIPEQHLTIATVAIKQVEKYALSTTH